MNSNSVYSIRVFPLIRKSVKFHNSTVTRGIGLYSNSTTMQQNVQDVLQNQCFRKEEERIASNEFQEMRLSQ